MSRWTVVKTDVETNVETDVDKASCRDVRGDGRRDDCRDGHRQPSRPAVETAEGNYYVIGVHEETVYNNYRWSTKKMDEFSSWVYHQIPYC